MAEELDSNISEQVSLDESTENSKEWGASFTVDGKRYAASLFWDSLQKVDKPFEDAKEASETLLVGADLFCVKHGKSPQLGLCVSTQGFEKGMDVAAVTAVTALSDSSSLLAVFKVDAGYWYLCVRNDVILSDGDVLFVKEEDAKEQFMSMLSVPDWSKKIAPAEWGIDETVVGDLSEIFEQGISSKLEKINALRGNELLIVIILSLLAGIFTIMKVNEVFFAQKSPQTKVVTKRAVKKVVKKVEKVEPAPWESMVDPAWLLDNCRSSIKSLVSIVIPGWDVSGLVTCSASGTTISWKKYYGRLAWIEMALANSQRTFASKTISPQGNTVVAAVNFQNIKKVNSIPQKTLPELRNIINDLFQTVNLSISLSDGKMKVGNKIYNYLGFKLNSKYDPDVWKDLLTKFSGLKINTIQYSKGVWKYDGLIFVQ